jgi:hypothetical protein
MKLFGLSARLGPALLLLGVVAKAASPTPNLVLWDTTSSGPGPIQVEDRKSWKVVPTDLLALEADPPKASSDPGYYGREYTFKGNAVIESRKLLVAFDSAHGCLALYCKDGNAEIALEPRGESQTSRRVAEICPGPSVEHLAGTRRVDIVRNAADEIVLRIRLESSDSTDASCTFALGRDEILEIKPSAATRSWTLKSDLAYAVAPGFIGDDLTFSAQEQPAEVGQLWFPAENLALGLVDGEAAALVLTWPQGSQNVKLRLGEPQGSKRLITALDFENDGKSLFLAALSAPGIWHREGLNPTFLEKDVPLKWKRPFPARWKTQLYEEGVKTTFNFRNGRGQVWRGVPGSYEYPVWFEGDDAVLHLSKKVAPKGEALIYYLEGQNTPPSIPAPVDILRSTLGRSAAESILDADGRKLRTHHRRGGEGVRRACTCGCTEAIQAVFQAGEEVTEKSYIEGALDDMVFFVHQHVERINEYRTFAAELDGFLKKQAQESPQVEPFVSSLTQTLGQLSQEYEVQKENMKSFEYADDLVRQTLALTGRKDTNNFKAYMDLLKAWREMGGAQDYVLAQCHMITRKLCQEAGYGCARGPVEAVALGEAVRKRCRQILRNPDGYEIWADY